MGNNEHFKKSNSKPKNQDGDPYAHVDAYFDSRISKEDNVSERKGSEQEQYDAEKQAQVIIILCVIIGVIVLYVLFILSLELTGSVRKELDFSMYFKDFITLVSILCLCVVLLEKNKKDLKSVMDSILNHFFKHKNPS